MVFQISAILLMSCFYGIYFTKLIVQNKKGTRSFHLAKGKHGRSALIEAFGLLLTVATPLAELVCILANTSLLPNWLRWVGLGICISATLLFLSAITTMSDSWRVGIDSTADTEMITHGIYGWSRNPAFTAFMLHYLGCLLIFFHWGLLIVSSIAVLFFHIQIVRNEEPHLCSAFGDDYLQYTQRVRRYFGRKKRRNSH